MKLQSAPAKATTAAPSPTVDPRVQAALTAYQGFNETTDNALLHPVARGKKLPPDADYTKYLFDPVEAQFANEVAELAARGLEYRGVPAETHARVKSIKLNASPWPKVTPSDCRTTVNWHVYTIKTGAQIPDPKVSVPPPYRSTTIMIYYQKHWGVYSFKFDSSQTCTV